MDKVSWSTGFATSRETMTLKILTTLDLL